jgi:hypothetical protein
MVNTRRGPGFAVRGLIGPGAQEMRPRLAISEGQPQHDGEPEETCAGNDDHQSVALTRFHEKLPQRARMTANPDLISLFKKQGTS